MSGEQHKMTIYGLKKLTEIKRLICDIVDYDKNDNTKLTLSSGKQVKVIGIDETIIKALGSGKRLTVALIGN